MNHHPHPPPSETSPLRADLKTVCREIERCATRITETRRRVGEGTVVSLNPLEKMIRATCALALSLPRDDGRRVRSDLESVLYDLDALETDMTRRFGDLVHRPLADGARPPTVGAIYQAGMERTTTRGTVTPRQQKKGGDPPR